MRAQATQEGEDGSAGRRIALARELLKLSIIVICLVSALALLIGDGSPLGFAPLLPWALWSKPGITGVRRGAR